MSEISGHLAAIVAAGESVEVRFVALDPDGVPQSVEIVTVGAGFYSDDPRDATITGTGVGQAPAG